MEEVVPNLAINPAWRRRRSAMRLARMRERRGESAPVTARGLIEAAVHDSQREWTLADWKPYCTGEEDPYVAGYDDESRKVAIYEFPGDDLMDKFLAEIGGRPHPYGGHRVILSK